MDHEAHKPLCFVLSREISGRHLILIGGGLFLLRKSTMVILDVLPGLEAGVLRRGLIKSIHFRT